MRVSGGMSGLTGDHVGSIADHSQSTGSGQQQRARLVVIGLGGLAVGARRSARILWRRESSGAGGGKRDEAAPAAQRAAADADGEDANSRREKKQAMEQTASSARPFGDALQRRDLSPCLTALCSLARSACTHMLCCCVLVPLTDLLLAELRRSSGGAHDALGGDRTARGDGRGRAGGETSGQSAEHGETKGGVEAWGAED